MKTLLSDIIKYLNEYQNSTKKEKVNAINFMQYKMGIMKDATLRILFLEVQTLFGFTTLLLMHLRKYIFLLTYFIDEFRCSFNGSTNNKFMSSLPKKPINQYNLNIIKFTYLLLSLKIMVDVRIRR